MKAKYVIFKWLCHMATLIDKGLSKPRLIKGIQISIRNKKKVHQSFY